MPAHFHLHQPLARCLLPADPVVLRRLLARGTALLDQRLVCLDDCLIGRVGNVYRCCRRLLLLVLLPVVLVLLLLVRSWEVEPVPLLGVQPGLGVECPRGLCFVMEPPQPLAAPVYCDARNPSAIPTS